MCRIIIKSEPPFCSCILQITQRGRTNGWILQRLTKRKVANTAGVLVRLLSLKLLVGSVSVPLLQQLRGRELIVKGPSPEDAEGQLSAASLAPSLR